MEKPRWGLGGRLVATASSAGLDIQIDLPVQPRPVVVQHNRATSFVISKMVSGYIVMQAEEFLSGDAIVGGGTKSALKEKEDW
jgi:hypothetical protein